LRTRRTEPSISWTFALALGLILIVCPRAYGDVGVILNESLDTSMERITGSGHTAVYLSRICPESPVKLRLCRPGEEGSVISNYINIGEDEKFEWNIAPLSMYVYGTQDARLRPMFGSEKLKEVLEEKYREGALSGYCESENCTTSNKAEWREMVSAGMIRSMYIFVVRTTVQQDLDLIAKFNALPNENHFNGVTRNCADFTKDIIDTYFPGSAHRDVLNDFGMTSPKAVARSFSHYAQNHPEMNFRVIHFSQIPGTFKRSSEARSGTEQLYHSKKLLIPMVIFADHELPVAVAAYVLTGRFNPEHEFEGHATVEPVQTASVVRLGDSGNGAARAAGLAAPAEVADVVGTSPEWNEYRKEFNSIVDEAVHTEVIPNRGYLDHFFKQLDETGTAFVDVKGGLWMDVPEPGTSARLGLSANNILSPKSDARLAYVVLLARIERELKSPKHSRETMPEFKDDWAYLQYARKRYSLSNVMVESRISPAESSRASGTD